MVPTVYHRLGGLRRARRALRHENLDIASVSAVARRYGFRDLGRFAANYRAFYGESPSASLRHALAGQIASLAGVLESFV